MSAALGVAAQEALWSISVLKWREGAWPRVRQVGTAGRGTGFLIRWEIPHFIPWDPRLSQAFS